MVGQHSEENAGADWGRIGLICCCVFAAVMAGGIVSTFGSGGMAGSPIDSALPGEDVYQEYVDEPATGDSLSDFGQSQGGLGALNPGDSTGVGGNIGLDNETYASTNTDVHFTVESSQAAYWRTGAYGSYTGSGWERSGDTEEYSGQIDHNGLPGEQVEYEVELERPASALPTAWRPSTVSGASGLEVTETGAIRSDQPLEAGTTFTGVSNAPERDVELLRATEKSYPPELASTYTSLPDDTPQRVGDFTDQLTADNDNPYDTAKAIQDWLRSEKNYSLQASEQSDHIADTFIFEMDAGYCEYFATGMTVMLRSQDIPARYTVGYSTGDPVGDNLFEVRGMNAHAWVEVYFEDLGWIKFDPTPGDSRLQTQQRALEQEEPNADYDVEEEGSPGEVFEPGDIRSENDSATNESDDTNSDDGTDDPIEPAGYETSLNRTPVPGEPIEVSVTYDGNPAPRRGVLFNGKRIGTTDVEGTVVGTVPIAEELRIEIQEPDTGTTNLSDDDIVGSNQGRSIATQPGASRGSPNSTATQLAQESDEDVYDIETNATVEVSGEILPGTEVTVTALIDDVPLENAQVSIDGEVHGYTNENGRATVILPEETGNATIAVERNIVSGETVVTVPALEISVETEGVLLLPGSEATVEASYGNISAIDAPVTIDGEVVARTGPDGTANVSLPLASSTTIEVSQNGMSESVTVDGMLRNTALLAGGLLLGIGGIVVGFVRSRHSPRDVARTVLGIPRLIISTVTWALVTVATQNESIVAAIRTRLAAVYAAALATVQGRKRPRELWAEFVAWLGAVRASIGADTASETQDARPITDAAGRITVRGAWRRLLDTVSVRDPSTRTPGELAEHGIERDELPPDAVETLRDSYRAVEYGHSPQERERNRVSEALASIDGATEASDAPDSDTGGSD
jgi:transglutaminase-like putative cysteine protease